MDDLDRVTGATNGRLERVDRLDRLRVNGRDRDPTAAYRRAVRRYERQAGRARTAAFAGAVVVVATVVAAVAGHQPWWLVVTAGGGWLAVTSVLRLRRLRPPPRPFVLAGAGVPGLPAPYPAGWVGAVVGRLVGAAPVPRPTTGADVVDRLAVVEEHLARVVPAVEALHPSAGHEMRQALAETAPLLHQQVHRLGVLDRLAADLSDAPAGAAATQAATQVAERLAEGVQAYERLLGAAATLLGAPDLDRGAAAVVGPAVEGLTAYAHGLAAADDVDRLRP